MTPESNAPGAASTGAGFAALGVPALLVASLERMGARVPTPVQQAAIPPAIEGRDMAAVASTGTGKTLAYLLPVAKRLLDEPPPRQKGRPVDPRRRLRAIVLCPTRELAQQVAREAARLFRGSVLRAGAVFGKSALAPQREMVAEGVDLLVGTPGRVRELCELDALSLAFVRQFVLDEADRMLDMGFLPQAKEILSRAPESRQMLFFTATLPRPVEAVVQEMLRDPHRVDLVGRERARVTGTPDERRDLGQHLLDLEDEAKTAVTVALVKDGKRRGVMVFCRTRRRAGWVAGALRRHEVRTVLIHGDRSQRQRQEALDAFAAGKADVVVATDVAARGLHVPAARCVINYDVPLLPEEYVHRVGRAGHGGGTAEAFTFRTPGDADRWTQVERTMRVSLVAEPAPAHRAYLRVRDGFAPDAEEPMGHAGSARPGREPRRAGRAGAQAGGFARKAGAGSSVGTTRFGKARVDKRRVDEERVGEERVGKERVGEERIGKSRSGMAHPAKAGTAAAGGGARTSIAGAVPEAPATTASGKTLAAMIRNAPRAVRKRKDRERRGGGKSSKALRGTQRKAPIAKGQKPGTGVRGSR